MWYLPLEQFFADFLLDFVMQASNMMKTRNRAKISAVNNAKTHAGKSKVQRGDRNGGTDQVLESVTITHTRRGKKTQVTGIAGPSSQPARSHSPAHSSSPDVAPPGPSGYPACSPSPACSPPPVATPFNASGQPVPEVLSHNTILKEGWYLLKRYFDNSASADEVYMFLEDVWEAELEQAFADITGCELDDHI